MSLRREMLYLTDFAARLGVVVRAVFCCVVLLAVV
jgi:hypothetical protein